MAVDANRRIKLHEELEWRRCANDADYFFSNYINVIDKTSPTGYSKFHMQPYQKEDLEAFENYNEIIILKARQLGISTLTAAYILWKMIFLPGFNVITTSKSDEAASNNNAKLTFAYNGLPDWIKDRFKKDSETTKTLQLRHIRTGLVSKMISVAATETVGASDTYDLAILDEFALSKYQDKTYQTVKPATNIAMMRKKSAAMIILSTARGPSNMFAKMFKAAVRKKNNFHAIFHPWFVSPWMTQEKYDIEERQFISQGKPWEIFSEYPASPEEAFRESGMPLFRDLPPEGLVEDFDFRGDIKETANPNGSTTLTFVPNEDGPLRILNETFLFPPEEMFYVLAADVSLGDGGDYQAAQIMTIDDNDPDETPMIVAYYHSNMTVATDFAEDIDRIGRYFHGRQEAALLAVENQGGYGSTVINELHKHLMYPNPYFYRRIGVRNRNSKSPTAFAFPMSRTVREAVLQRLLENLSPVNAGLGEVPQPRMQGLYPLLRGELGTFVRQTLPSGTVKYAADVGTNDDLVMSLAICLWVLLESFSGELDAQPVPIREDTIASRFFAILEADMNRTGRPNDELIYL